LIIFNQTWHYTLAKKKNRPLFLCGSFRFFCDFLGFNCQSSVNTTPEFDIKKIDKSISKRIFQKIEWLAQNPKILDTPLKYLPNDLKGLQKYRIGDYRILFWVDHPNNVITLYGVEHRRSIYDKLK
ncbi:MAG: type II toxin-antitoxin system RelE/ParE family toxin, partial [bacterium]